MRKLNYKTSFWLIIASIYLSRVPLFIYAVKKVERFTKEAYYFAIDNLWCHLFTIVFYSFIVMPLAIFTYKNAPQTRKLLRFILKLFILLGPIALLKGLLEIFKYI